YKTHLHLPGRRGDAPDAGEAGAPIRRREPGSSRKPGGAGAQASRCGGNTLRTGAGIERSAQGKRSQGSSDSGTRSCAGLQAGPAASSSTIEINMSITSPAVNEIARESQELRARVQRFVDVQNTIRKEVHKVIIGQDEVIEHVLISLFVGGHCLLTGLPGTAKTLLVRTMARALGLRFSRIQFT